MSKFDIFDGVEVDGHDVRDHIKLTGLPFMTAKNKLKAIKLHSKLTDMKYSLNEYENGDLEQKFDDLLDILIGGIDWDTWA